MAEHIQGITIPQDHQGSDNPKFSYDISYIASRNTDKTVTYTFTIRTYFTESYLFGTPYDLDCTIQIGDVSEKEHIKQNEYWNTQQGFEHKTTTISITVPSNIGNEKQFVSFTMTRPDGGYYSGIVANTGEKYYVISPAISAPTPMKSIFVNIDGVWEQCLIWIKDNDAWKQGVPWIKKDGVWKK